MLANLIGSLAIVAVVGTMVIVHALIGRHLDGSFSAWWNATEPPPRYRK